VTKNTGTAYEVLTQEVFSRLHAQERLCTNVERNVFLEGKSGARHQIDVTFTVEVGGISYRTIVQCKDWGSPVKQGQVLEFKQVLDEIPGQPRGIIVARSGFQEGAKAVAAHHGIMLYELREPKDVDWNGLIRTIITQAHFRAPHFENVRLVLDEVAIREELKARGLPGIDVNFSGHPGAAPTVLASGAPCDLNRILNARVPKEGVGPVQVRHDFTEAVFVEVPGSPLPRLRLQAIEATIRVTEHHREIRVNVDHLIAYAFRDVLSGEVRFLGADGQRVGGG
jgi:Restriction endonuclease